MRDLKLIECHTIGGGDICLDGECISISSNGICDEWYQLINTNIQAAIDGTLSLEQVGLNLGPVPIMYLARYAENMEQGTLYKI